MSEPLFIPVILGTPRKGRQSELVARFLVEQLSQRDDLTTELIDIRSIAIAAWGSIGLELIGTGWANARSSQLINRLMSVPRITN